MIGISVARNNKATKAIFKPGRKSIMTSGVGGLAIPYLVLAQSVDKDSLHAQALAV